MLGCVAKHLLFMMIVHVRLAVTQTAVRIMEPFAVSYAERDVCGGVWVCVDVAGVSYVWGGVGVGGVCDTRFASNRCCD